MRIISKHRDYYDSAMAYGQDKSVVFVRHSEDVKENDLLKSVAIRPRLATRKNKKIQIAFGAVIVVFCGKTYRGIECRKRSVDDPFCYTIHEEIKVFYNHEEFIKYLAENEIELESEPRWLWQKDKTNDHIKEYLSKQATTELEEFCINNRYVTLTYMEDVSYDFVMDKSDPHWIANGMLLTSQFYRVYNSFQAYQELDMFISGTLPQSTQMPIEIEDKYRIPQHGFDQYSFRKAPTKDKK